MTETSDLHADPTPTTASDGPAAPTVADLGKIWRARALSHEPRSVSANELEFCADELDDALATEVEQEKRTKGTPMSNNSEGPADAIHVAEKIAEAALGILRTLTEGSFEAADGHDQRMQALTVYGDSATAMVRALAVASRTTRLRWDRSGESLAVAEESRSSLGESDGPEDAMLIHTRFDYWPSAARKDARVAICRANLPQVPNVGERVNLEGNPYIVHERGWAIGAEIDGPGKFYAYVGVFKAGEFDGPGSGTT